LAGTDAVTVEATGFTPSVTARVQQCTAPFDRAERCAAALPVTFDSNGEARFIVAVAVRFETPNGESVDCDGSVPRCTIAVVAPEEHALAPIVFGVEPAPAATVTMARAVVRSGDVVRITGRGFPPGATGQVAQCVPAATLDGRTCGGRAADASIQFDDRGEGTVDYRVRAHDACRRGRPCGITVVTPGQLTGVNLVLLTFGAASAPDYTPSRLLLWLGFAVVLLVVAGWLMRTTDWSPIGENADDPEPGVA
jgi:hypothetical protein